MSPPRVLPAGQVTPSAAPSPLLVLAGGAAILGGLYWLSRQSGLVPANGGMFSTAMIGNGGGVAFGGGRGGGGGGRGGGDKTPTVASDAARLRALGIKGRMEGGIVRADAVPARNVLKAHELGYIDLDAFNNAPSGAALVAFLRSYPEVRAELYVVTAARGDARVTIEGLNVAWKGVGAARRAAIRRAFAKFKRTADEYTDDASGMRAWWD